MSEEERSTTEVGSGTMSENGARSGPDSASPPPTTGPRLSASDGSTKHASAWLYRRRRILLSAWPYLLSALVAALGLQAWVLKGSADRRTGFGSTSVGGGLQVSSVELNSPAAKAGLLEGDVLLSVDGRPVRSRADYHEQASQFRRGVASIVLIERNHKRLDLRLLPGMPVPWADFLLNLLALGAYACLAWLALRLSPAFSPADVLSLFCLGVAFELALPNAFSVVGWPAVTLVSNILFYLLMGLQFSLELHLAASVPRPLASVRRWPWLVRGCYLLGASVAATLVAVYLAEAGLTGRALQPPKMSAEDLLNTAVLPFWSVAVISIYAHTASRYPTASGRAQARLAAAGVLPWTVYVLASFVASMRDASLPAWIDAGQSLILLVYPSAILVALLREQRRKRAIAETLAAAGPPTEDLTALAQRLVSEVASAIAPETLSLLVRSETGRDFPVAASAPEPPRGSQPVLRESAVVLSMLERTEKGIDLVEDAPPHLPAEEVALLNALNAELLIAGLGDERDVVAVLVLGPKSSRSPYTNEDRRLVGVVMRQFAGGVEHLRLRKDLERSRKLSSSVVAHFKRQRLNLLRECPRCGLCADESVTNCPRDGADLAVIGPVERTIAERYRLEKLLGRGGMGSVYEAMDLQLKRRVAVKVLTGMGFEDPAAVSRFEREARVTARIHHPNVIAIFDYGHLEAGGAFIVMEALEGQSLESILSRAGALPADLVAGWAEQILAALQAAHALRILHRDLKPANIFIARPAAGPPVVKLLDFGLAKVLAEGDLASISLTAPGILLGTMSYMAPEQLTGAPCDERTDLFAFGTVVVEALTGRRPFVGVNYTELMRAILNEPYHLIGADETHRHMDGVLQRLLAKNPWERYSSAVEAQAAVVPALQELARASPGSWAGPTVDVSTGPTSFLPRPRLDDL